MKIRLRILLAAFFTIIATVPVLILGIWVGRTALQTEIDHVREKHLLLAKNTALVLDRYAQDSAHAFEQIVSRYRNGADLKLGSFVEASYKFNHFRIVDNEGRAVALAQHGSEAIPFSLDRRIKSILAAAGTEIEFSDVVPDGAGEPTIYLSQRIAGDRIAIAALRPDFIVELQTAITFGRKGHAAIVDRAGNVIAHPKRTWQSSIKNIAKVKPVQQMMAGESGVTTFYSPAVKQDMISGFTTVPRTGWGVMVPQPMSELIERAQAVKQVALTLALVGILAAALLGWFVAGRIIRPVDAVRLTARRITEGKLNARVPPLRWSATTDMRELADGFNEMAQRIQDDQQSLALALDHAQNADRAKTKFLANMSHELRTPLNAIIGFSQTMENQVMGPVGNERYQGYVVDIRRSGEHLLSIIHNILDLSKIESGKVEIEDDTVSITDLIDDAVNMLRIQANDARIDLSVMLEDDLPLFRGSAVKLKQILVNLLSNAVKYTVADGSVTVTAARDYGGGVAISIEDTGIGMSSQDLAVALIPFGRVAGGAAQAAGGTGLGLPLAKRLAELHGGRLVIKSDEGAGTTVILHLPAARTLDDAA